MTAWYLRGILLVELLGAAALSSALADVVGSAAALVAGLALVVAPSLLLVGLGAAVAARRPSSRPPGIAATRRRDRLFEAAAFVVLFQAIQPFAGLWMGSDAVGRLAPGRRPLLLVHGYCCNRGLWWWLRRALRAHGHAVTTVDLGGPFADIDRFAEVLDARIDALLAETGAAEVVLVTHSMGGLVARALLARRGAGRIARLLTLATPHHGTVTARLGLGRNARQMEPTSPWLARLDALAPPPIDVLSVWSAGDEVVVPPVSSRLRFGREVVFGRLGHVAMVVSPAVRDLLLAELAGTVTGAGPA